MMDLIDRAAYRAELRSRQEECYKACQDAKNEVEHDHWAGVYAAFVDAKLTLNKLPTIEAVPLEPLCEWLEENAGLPTDDYMISKTAWERKLKHWMEGQHDRE